MTDPASLDTMRRYLEDRLGSIVWNGAEGKARCPLHEDAHESLSVNVEKSVFNCHAGCGGGTLGQLAKRAGWDRVPWNPNHNGSDGNGSGRREVSRSDYLDETRKVLYQIVRFSPKDFRPYNPNTGEWRLNGVRRVPYHLPELIDGIKAGRHVFITEGEKDVDNLRRLGVVATCNQGGVGGAKLWTSFARYFTPGTQVILCGDADKPGRKLMGFIGRTLKAAGCEVREVDLGYPVTENHGKDISDWLSEEHTGEELLELARNAEEWEASEPISETAQAAGSAEARDDRVMIVANNRDLREISAECIRALVSANEPARIFCRGSELVRIVDGKFDPLTESRLRHELARVAVFAEETQKGKINKCPPRWR